MATLLIAEGIFAQLSTQLVLVSFTGLADAGSATAYGQRNRCREREVPNAISHQAHNFMDERAVEP